MFAGVEVFFFFFFVITYINLRGIKRRKNPWKLATYGAKDQEKTPKYTTQFVLDTTMRIHTQITVIHA
jgi:hypothetical protein